MRRICLLLLAFALLFFGCTEKESAYVTESGTLQTTTAQPEPQPPVVSHLAKAQFLEPLENFSWEREYAPEYVMIHFTSAAVLSKDDPYDMQRVRGIFEDGGVSIHYIIDREGNILCYIPEQRAAWHAGKGSFANDERYTNAMNKYSIGIEIVARGSQKDMAQYFTAKEYRQIDKSLIGYTEEQYASLKALVSDICQRNSIPLDREHIIGHSEYNPIKSDPGELFDWERIFE